MSVRIQYRLGVSAVREQIWDVLSDLDHWGDWNPLYPKAEGTIAFGGAMSVWEHQAGHSPQRLDFKVTDWAPGEHLYLRAPAGFMTTRLQFVEIEGLADQGCIVACGVIFNGWSEVGQGKKNRALKAGFEAMGEGLKARVESLIKG
jgi:hypothetical protein